MREAIKIITVWLMAALWLPSALAFQANSNRINPGELSVFLDMTRGIDEDYIRQEISAVSYVRDKGFADVHIIMSSHRVGNTGTTYNISFIGYNEYSDMNYQLNYWAPASNTLYQTRRGYTEVIKRGLVPFITASTLSDILIVDFHAKDTVSGEEREEREVDPWNHWVFELYGGSNISSESTRSSMHIRYGVFADRITEESKTRIRPYGNYNERRFDTDNGTIIRSTVRGGLDSYHIISLGDHWGAGIFGDAVISTFDNIRFSFEAKPALEYSLFPYREATRRSITARYQIGAGYFSYVEETLFFKKEEILYGHALMLSANYRQPWGTFRSGVTLFHHLHDFKSNRVSLSGNLNLRVVEGLGLNISSSYSIINDQRNISGEGLSLEDILLEQRRRQTDYQFSFSVGLSYTFGSRITGIYNPRL